MDINNTTPYMVQPFPTMGPGDKNVLTIIVKATFEIWQDHSVHAASEQMPIEFGDQLYDPANGGSVKFESDMVPFKPRADIALVGKAYTPHGKAMQSLDVRLRVGKLSKTIRVFGDRKWIYPGRMLPIVMSDTMPFVTTDLLYERAFGGIDKEGGGYCKENLVGRGYFEKKSLQVIDNALLPNLEDPDHPIRSWDDRPKPAGFGFYGKSWEPRLKMLGTYDAKWQKERAPKPPLDFRYDFYNAAHPDLQMNGYLRGDEDVELIHLTPEGRLRFQLPGVKIHCAVIKSHDRFKLLQMPFDQLVTAKFDSSAEYEETVVMNLDTLCLIPDENRFYLVWRGLCPIADMIGMEVVGVRIW